jgi:hypothetical protein
MALLLAAASCSAEKPPSSPAAKTENETPSARESAPSPGAAAPSASTTAEATPPRKHRPYEITNHCADVVTVVFGDDPKDPKAGSRTVAPSASIEGPRDADGNQTVWLRDASGEPLLRVRVTRGMKNVVIGRSCRTLDAQ